LQLFYLVYFQVARVEMLIITLQNDDTGEDGYGNYNYKVYVNKKQIAGGHIVDHYRGDWRRLIIDLASSLEEEFAQEEKDYQEQKRPDSIPF